MNDAQTNTVLLRGGRMVLPETVVQGGSLLVERDRIARIDGEEKNVRLERTLNLEGLTLFPGFVDAHIHGAVGVDAMRATSEDLSRVARFLAGAGVTAWLPTLVPAEDDDYRRAVEAIEGLMRQEEARPAVARAVGVHYEGPFVSQHQCGALRTQFFRSYTEPSDLDRLTTPGTDNAVRMMTLAPEIDGGIELVRELRHRGWIVSIGHTRAGIETLDQALAAGARHMTHFMNAMAPLHHRAPGPVGWGLSKDEVTCDLIADGIHLDPFVLRLLLKTKGADRLLLISDAIAAAGQGDGEYMIWEETIEVKDGRTRNARGSLAGSVITMLNAVRMMISLGASEVEVARMAATNPARLLGIDGECGSIEEGKRADLVALDVAGNVQLTIVGGEIAFRRE